MPNQQRLLSLLIEASRIYCDNLTFVEQHMGQIERELESLNASIRRLANTQRECEDFRREICREDSSGDTTNSAHSAVQSSVSYLEQSLGIETIHPSDDDQELLVEAMDLFMEQGQASISMVQRRFRVGYSRAARIVDQLEVMGFVSASLGSKAREVLINHGEWVNKRAQLTSETWVPACSNTTHTPSAVLPVEVGEVSGL